MKTVDHGIQFMPRLTYRLAHIWRRIGTRLAGIDWRYQDRWERKRR